MRFYQYKSLDRQDVYRVQISPELNHNITVCKAVNENAVDLHIEAGELISMSIEEWEIMMTGLIDIATKANITQEEFMEYMNYVGQYILNSPEDAKNWL